MQSALMLGAGTTPCMRRIKGPDSASEADTKWTTLDINDSAKPDHVFDLNDLEDGRSIPGSPYDEIHAYEILEHYGRQGDYSGFFTGFRMLHKALVPNGLLFLTVPQDDTTWGDPGHCRSIQAVTLAFLVEDHYKQLGRTRCTDYREFVAPYWWKIEEVSYKGPSLEAAMRAV